MATTQSLNEKKNKKKQIGRPLSPLKVRARIEFSELACRLIYADTIEQKKTLEQEMRAREKQWSIDTKVMKEYNSLISDLEYYHTKEELGDIPFDNNKAETLNGVLKKKLSRMQGFKTFETGRLHLKGFWQSYRKKKFSEGAPSESTLDCERSITTTAEPVEARQDVQQILAAEPVPELAPPIPTAYTVCQGPEVELPSQELVDEMMATPASTKSRHPIPIGMQYLDAFSDPKNGVPAFIKRAHYEILHMIGQANSDAEIQEAGESTKNILHETINNLHLQKIPLGELALTAMVSRLLSSYSLNKVGKNLDGETIYKYKSLPAHMRAAKMLMEVNKQDIKVGDTIAYVMTAGGSGVKPVELAGIEEIDIDKYIDMIKSTFRRIISALNINFEADILRLPRQQSLEDLFWSK